MRKAHEIRSRTGEGIIGIVRTRARLLSLTDHFHAAAQGVGVTVHAIADALIRRLHLQRVVGALPFIPPGLRAALGYLVPLKPADLPERLPHVHAHNDSSHRFPLREALLRGFASVEADATLYRGRFLLGHSVLEKSRGLDLERDYLEPLATMARLGPLFPTGSNDTSNAPSTSQPGNEEPVYVHVDIKSAGLPALKQLEAIASRYSDVLSEWTGEQYIPRRLTLIATGNSLRAADEWWTQPATKDHHRRVFLDGRPEDLAARPPTWLMPMVSMDFTNFSAWRGFRAIAASEEAAVREFISSVHEQGRQARLWSIPTWPYANHARVSRWLLNAGLDWVSVDNLRGAHRLIHSAH